MQIKERVKTLLFLTIIPIILVHWFYTPTEVLLLSIAILLLWGSAVILAWRSRPIPEKNPAVIRNFQIGVSLSFFTILLLLALANYIDLFQGSTSIILIWTILSIAMLSLLGFIFMSFRHVFLEKAERSRPN